MAKYYDSVFGLIFHLSSFSHRSNPFCSNISALLSHEHSDFIIGCYDYLALCPCCPFNINIMVRTNLLIELGFSSPLWVDRSFHYRSFIIITCLGPDYISSLIIHRIFPVSAYSYTTACTSFLSSLPPPPPPPT